MRHVSQREQIVGQDRDDLFAEQISIMFTSRCVSGTVHDVTVSVDFMFLLHRNKFLNKHYFFSSTSQARNDVAAFSITRSATTFVTSITCCDRRSPYLQWVAKCSQLLL